MKLLVINQFFWPDAAATAQILTDFTREFGHTHDITVIASAGDYQALSTTEAAPPVRALRVPGLPYRLGLLGRLLSHAIYSVGAAWLALTQPKQDIVLTMTTPPLIGVLGSLLKCTHGTRHYVWEMDVFPDMMRSHPSLHRLSWLINLLTGIENLIRRHADGVIVLGACMQQRLVMRGVPAERIRIVENWASIACATPLAQSGPLHVLYSGNLGVAHDVETVAAAIEHFQAGTHVNFTFAGGGCGRRQLQHRFGNAGLVRFEPYVERESLDKHLATATVGLVTQRRSSLGAMVPSKVYGLLGAGRPVLFVGPATATPALLIRRWNCGWQVDPGDAVTLIRLLTALADDRDQIVKRGRQARRAYEADYTRGVGAARLAAAIGMAQVVEPCQTQTAAALAAPGRR